jgi:biopolymer transport protein ExbB
MAWLVIVEWLSRLILLILVLLSFYSIAIILERRKFYRSLRALPLNLKEVISEERLQAENLDPFAQKLLSELKETTSGYERVVDYFIFSYRQELEKGLPVLAILGSTTPFIGLLGTILGIIVSFGQLSKGVGDTNTVMFMLAEALILTAVGLVVAIPAVIAFNIFSKKARRVISEWQSITNVYTLLKIKE